MKKYISSISRSVCIFMQTILCMLDKKTPVVVDMKWDNKYPIYKNSDYGVAVAIPGMLVTDGFYVPEIGIKVVRRTLREWLYNYRHKFEVHISSAAERMFTKDEMNCLIEWKFCAMRLIGYKRSMPNYDDMLKIDAMLIRKGYPIKTLSTITHKQMEGISNHPDASLFCHSLGLLRARLGALAEYQLDSDTNNPATGEAPVLTDYIKHSGKSHPAISDRVH